MKVFKFGGASVNSASAVKNMAAIVKSHLDEPILVVVSAMGKTTNALERMIPGFASQAEKEFETLQHYHLDILNGLFPDKSHPVFARIQELFTQLHQRINQAPNSYNFDYDQIVSFGELISTTIVAHFIHSMGLNCQWVDVRSIVRTDHNYREGHVDWDKTLASAQRTLSPLLQPNPQSQPVVITQGFIAGTESNTTTTLGREGSDYSASILSFCMDAHSMTIWKDVPGFLNADPKFFKNTIKINQIPYNEAIELAYYGASVIHPKTVKPIQNKNICLNIKSFIDPQAQGSIIGPFSTIDPQTPLYIFKNHQSLISIHPKDFSFIAEDNLQTIFAALAELNIRVNLMQNSALSFSLCIDHNPILLEKLQERLGNSFRLRYNENLQLITIRYFTQQIIDQIVDGRTIILQQRSRSTTQLLVSE